MRATRGVTSGFAEQARAIWKKLGEILGRVSKSAKCGQRFVPGKLNGRLQHIRTGEFLRTTSGAAQLKASHKDCAVGGCTYKLLL